MFPLFAAVFVFHWFPGLDIRVESRVRVNSVNYFSSLAPFTNCCAVLACKFTGFWMLLTVFEVFIGVHGLALIRVRFLFLLLSPSPCRGRCLCTIELCMGIFV